MNFDRNEAIKLIRTALQSRSGKSWSVALNGTPEPAAPSTPAAQPTATLAADAAASRRAASSWSFP